MFNKLPFYLLFFIVLGVISIYVYRSSSVPTSYSHSIRTIPIGETQYLEVVGNHVRGLTVDYTIVKRPEGYGLVHNWNVNCAQGTQALNGACFETTTPQQICGPHVPELRITAISEDTFELSCELSVHKRADSNKENGFKAQFIVDKELSRLKEIHVPSSSLNCGLYAQGFKNSGNPDLPNEFCLYHRQVEKNWQCPEQYELAAIHEVNGKLVEIQGRCETEISEVLCLEGYQLNHETMMCEFPATET